MRAQKRLPLILICLLFIVNAWVEGKGVSFAGVGAKTCMRILGCFEITPDFFHILRRPINLLPQNRALINTQFYLFTKSNVREPDILNAEKKDTILSSHFDPSVPTKFIIHGYIDTQGFGPWQDKLKDEFLLNGNHNIIIVDWSGGNSLPYTQATANTRVVGAEVAYLVKILQESVGANPQDCHILGHSLGSHAAGYAGERIPGLGRITGLDPAEPYFQGLPPSVRLDETDADFVDVIHTDSKSILLLGLGMSQAIGHVDFYPNDGTNQPGCKKEKITSFITEGITEGIRRFVGCNHQRAVDFYQSSIVLRKCASVAYECRDWKRFLEGKCTECGPDGSRCAILGDKAIESKGLNQKNKKLYVKTSGDRPYCIFHYKVMIKLYKASGARDEKGTWQLVFPKQKGTFTAKLTSRAADLYPGSIYTYLVTSNEDIGKMKSVTLTWKSSGISLNPLDWLRKKTINVDYIKVIPMNIVDQENKKENTGTFCLADRSKNIESGKSTVFTKRAKC